MPASSTTWKTCFLEKEGRVVFAQAPSGVTSGFRVRHVVIQVALAQLCLVLPMITSLEGLGGQELGYKQSYDA